MPNLSVLSYLILFKTAIIRIILWRCPAGIRENWLFPYPRKTGLIGLWNRWKLKLNEQTKGEIEKLGNECIGAANIYGGFLQRFFAFFQEPLHFCLQVLSSYSLEPTWIFSSVITHHTLERIHREFSFEWLHVMPRALEDSEKDHCNSPGLFQEYILNEGITLNLYGDVGKTTGV